MSKVERLRALLAEVYGDYNNRPLSYEDVETSIAVMGRLVNEDEYELKVMRMLRQYWTEQNYDKSTQKRMAEMFFATAMVLWASTATHWAFYIDRDNL